MDPSQVPMITGDDLVIIRFAGRFVLVGSLLMFCYLADQLWNH